MNGILTPLCLLKNPWAKLWLTTNRNRVTCGTCLRKMGKLDAIFGRRGF